MKTDKYTPAILPLMAAAAILLAGSCQKSRDAAIHGTMDVVLNIGTQGSISLATKAGDDNNAEPYEGIRTLRAIVVSSESSTGGRRLLYNEKHTVDGSQAPEKAVLSTSLVLHDIPVGPANIYLIANEESIGMEYNSETLLSQEYFDDEKLLLLDKGWAHFQKDYEGIAAYGLPMSGLAENVTIESGMSAVSMTLYRVVVKLNLAVENGTSSNMTLNWVEFGNFISDRVYLFPHLQLDVPDSTLYKNLRYPENGDLGQSLSPGTTADMPSVYIYPNYAYKDPVGSNPYTLSLATDRKEYSPSQLSANMNSMPRNTQYNITARITASATISIRYEKVPWTAMTVEVPPFE